MKSNIALIGFMGAGKSAVGRALAHKLKMQHLELDEMVERKAGKPITDIFRSEGERVFRRMESEVVAEASQKEKAVISCGGGAVLDPSNIEALKTNAVVVYLQAGADDVMQRVKDSVHIRPLLARTDPSRTIAELLKARRPLYEKAADLVVDTSGLSVNEVVDRLIAVLTETDESVNSKK